MPKKVANKLDNQRKRPYIQKIFYLESRIFFLPSEGMSKKKNAAEGKTLIKLLSFQASGFSPPALVPEAFFLPPLLEAPPLPPRDPLAPAPPLPLFLPLPLVLVGTGVPSSSVS